MAKVVYDEKIKDLTVSWEGYKGRRVEELIKDYLGRHESSKIGYMILPKAQEGDGFYHIKCFASKETYDQWLEDEILYASNLLFDLAIPIIEDNGTTYAARIYTSLTTSDPIISTEKKYLVPIMYKGTVSSGGITENVGIRGNLVIQRSTDRGNTWETVGTDVLNSVDPDATAYTDIDIGQYFSSSNPQQIRMRVSYTVYDDTDTIVATAQSSWLTFSDITYTNLDLNFAVNFESPINGETAEGFPIAYTLSGEVARKLHVKISGERETLYVVYQIPANEYTNSLTTYRQVIKDSDTYKILSHGIHTIEAWLTCSDGSNPEGITSRHAINQLLIINPSTSGADLTRPWVLIQDVKTEAINYVAMSQFLRYSVWIPSKTDPFLPSEDTMNLSFLLTDYGSDGITWDTEYLRSENVVSSGIRYTLPATIEIENSVDDTLYCYLHVYSGEEDILYSSCGRRNFAITVDNREKFSPTSGANFFLNPKNRNNSEANPFTIINAMNGEKINAEFVGFEAINDLWMTSSDDNQKVLRIKAGQRLTIDYDWLSPFRTATSANVTLDIDFKVKNVTDEESPIIQALEELATNFIGLKMSPMSGLIYSKNHTTNEAQDFRWQEDERTHISINIVSALYPTADSSTTLPLCRVFINGVINREFLFGTRNHSTGKYDISSGEWYQKGSKIVLGQDMADLDIYSIRCYHTELSSANILKNYIATLPTSDQKIKVRDDNNILSGSGLISADSLKAQGKNVLIWHGIQPYHENSNTGTGWWEIHIYDPVTGKEDLDHSGTICKTTASLKPTRQGSTANTYYYSNIQTKLKNVKVTIFVALDKIHPDYEYSEDAVIVENGVRGIRTVDGWIDGNGLYRGPYYQIDSSCPLGQKMVLKINYASCMQSHLMGGCKMYNDLHTTIVGPNKLQKDTPNARVAKFQAPFHYFTQGLDEITAVYQGPGTFGPGKMDDKTWGYNKKKHKMFCMIEGADNNLPLTDFRIPWQSNRISCEEEDGEVVGWIYNKATSLDLDKCVLTKRLVPVEITISEGITERQLKELDAPSEEVENKIKDMVNFLYKHNPRINYYIGTFENFVEEFSRGGSSINTDDFYWCTSGEGAYCLKRFDNVDQEWVDAGWNEETEEVCVRNLNTEFPGAVSAYPGQWIEINKAFINYIATDARDNFGNYFKVDSALFHYAFINQFLAGTDNCSKNTYYVLDPETLLWELHQDDVDTTLATDNSGFQSKPYYIDRQNPYPEGSIKTCYEGGYNTLFNLIEAMYESHGEIRSMMYTIFTNMGNLVTNDDVGLSHTPWGALQKYFFATQDYFSATAYNEAARIRYEYPSTLGFISDRGVNPITQSMGDQLQAEKQFMKRRLVLFASYAEWGDFSRSNAGNIGLADATTNFGIEACKDIDGNNTNIVFNLVPHQYIYPTGAVGETTHYLRQRCKPGETYTFQVNGTTPVAGDTNVVLYAANYYRSFGNLGDLSVLPTRDMTVNGKRLVEFIAEPSNSSKPQFRPHTLTINAPLIEKFSIKGCSYIQGGMNFSNCIRLKSLDTRQTSLDTVTFPESASLTKAYLPDKLTSLTTVKLPNLSDFVIDGTSYLREISLAGVPLIDTYLLVSKLYADKAVVEKIHLYDIVWNNAASNILDYLANIENNVITGSANITSNPRDITFAKKLAYIKKWGNVDDPNNDFYITYPIDPNVNKIYNIRVTGERYIDTLGTYQFGISLYDSSGNKTIYGNDFTNIRWEYRGYGYGDKDDSHNWIDENTGILHVNSVGPEESYSYIGYIKCIMTKIDGSTLENEYESRLYHKLAVVGDYVFADGTYSDLYDDNKTVIGICIYVNPDNNNERIAMAPKNLESDHYWGLYNSDEYMAGVVLREEAGLTTSQIYDLKDLPNINGNGLHKSTEMDAYNFIRDDNFRDTSTKDGFMDYKSIIDDVYNKSNNSVEGAAAAMVGYVTTSENVRDNQEQPSSFAVKGPDNFWIIPKGTRVPWGFLQNLYIINHRNTVLLNIVTSTNEETGEVLTYGLPVPGKTETQTEWDNLTQCLDDITAQYNAAYKELYFPAASKCYAYCPKVKEGEKLSDKFNIHNWFLPCSGDLFRMYWYHRQGYTEETDTAIFTKPTQDMGNDFTGLGTSSAYWSSCEYFANNAWFVWFGTGQIYFYNKSFAHAVRPLIAF